MSGGFNLATDSTKAANFGIGSDRTSKLAISDAHVEALMGGHPNNLPDTRRKDVTQPRLHDAYLGSNEMLSNTMLDLLITSDISFVTSTLMPLFYHPNPTIKWKEINEDNGLMEPEQEGGVPSLKSTSMSEYSAFMQRFGRAAIFSHGFANTEEGRSLFRVRLAHMAKEIQRTLDIRGLYAIIASQNHYMSMFSNMRENYDAGGALRPIDCFERELASFAMLQKEERGLYTLDERLRTQLELNGANPDSWLMLTEMMSHCAMENAEVEYNRAGSVARVHLRKGKDAMATFRGCKVYPVKDYDVYGRSINAFKRTRIIGDYWIVRDFASTNKDLADLDLHLRSQTDVYCCGTDRFENFSLNDIKCTYANFVKPLNDAQKENISEAEARKLWHSNKESMFLYVDAVGLGTERQYNLCSVFAPIEDKDQFLWEGVRKGFEDAFKNALPADKTENSTWIDEDYESPDFKAKRPIANLPFKHEDFKKQNPFDTNGPSGFKEGHLSVLEVFELLYGKKICPFSMICYRPFRRYTMGSAVLMEGGSNTGITAYAHTDMQVGNDPQSKQTLVHFTGNFASVVLDSRRIAVAPDVYCCDYQGGEGNKYVDYGKYQHESGNPQAYVQKHHEDIFAVLGPYFSGHETKLCSDPVDITGSYRQCVTTNADDCHLPGGEILRGAYKLHDLAHDVDSIEDMLHNEQVFSQNTNVNTTCFRATQKIPSKDGTNTHFIRGSGHFGDFIGPGARAARKGISSEFKAMKYEEMNLKEMPF